MEIHMTTYACLKIQYLLENTHKHIYLQLLSIFHLNTCWGRGTEFHLPG